MNVISKFKAKNKVSTKFLLGNLRAFLSSADFLQGKLNSKGCQCVKLFGSRSGLTYDVGPDLGPNYLQGL